MQFSFVSKLVAMQLESSPIHDRHVLAFFGKKAPAKSAHNEDRIAWFVSFLQDVAGDYATWAQDVKVMSIIERFKERDRRLMQCDVVRLVDFLVWKVGNQKLI